MRNIPWLLLLLMCFSTLGGWAQITGTVTDEQGNTLPFVNIYFEGTLNGTTTNDNGQFELEVDEEGTYTIVFKYLGFRTHRETILVQSSLRKELLVQLFPDRYVLNAVEVSAKDNPANGIIKNAISRRKAYQEKLRNYTADFYSKGLIKILNAPEKILGQPLGDFGGGLDSTRSGIIYLSETLSEISRKNNDFKEHILASKVSGDDNGFSFNNASDVDFSLYNNTISFGNELISPIANNAFSYYRYELIRSFYDDTNNLINHIRVIPKRPKDNVFTGSIYIVEGSWALYATDLIVFGEQAQLIAVDTIRLNQQFNYSRKDDLWLKVLQSLDFQFGLIGIKGSGRFIAGYKNFVISPDFNEKTFGNEILSFEENANQKDSLFWEEIRPVPLTGEELTDYAVKDSVQDIRKTEKYLDSVDAIQNRFHPIDILFGYTRNHRFKEKSFTVKGLLGRTYFNTVQGWHSSLELEYVKSKEEKGSQLAINTSINYGLSEEVLRAKAFVGYRFNRFSRPYLRFGLGNDVIQFNRSNPITPLANTIASLLFENNFAKFYQNTFAEVLYSEEAVNGIRVTTSLAYEERAPLFNTTNFSILGRNDEPYTSNNPLDRNDYENAAIDRHTIATFSLDARVRFNQKYLRYPDAKFNIPDERYPTLSFGYQAGFASDNSSYHYHKFSLSATQDITLADKGVFSYNLKAGVFLNGAAISFADYHHFNGNRTRVTRGSYLQSFFLLPYYDFSTNKDFFEVHAEHNFKGFILGKIPILNWLKANLILSGKYLVVQDRSPYTEWGISLDNLGWNKFRFLRTGYVQNHFEGVTERGFNLGIRF